MPSSSMDNTNPAPTSTFRQFGHPLQLENAVQPPPRPSRKRAMLIGINYFGQRGRLRYCIKDAYDMRACLTQKFNYKHEDMVILSDDSYHPFREPTKQNILRGMLWLVKDSQPNDLLFFYYSGHAGQSDGLEGDLNGIGQTICPVDFQSAGPISDAEMYRIMVANLPAGVRLAVIIDSFHTSNEPANGDSSSQG